MRINLVLSHIFNDLFRLENIRSEFHWINNQANLLKTMGLVYKQRLETRSSDLAKAETEVSHPKHYVVFFHFYDGVGDMDENLIHIPGKHKQLLERPNSCCALMGKKRSPMGGS